MLTMDPVSGTAEETINNTLYDLFVIEWSWYHVSLNYCPTCDHAHAHSTIYRKHKGCASLG